MNYKPFALSLLAITTTAHAQWKTETYLLKGGWNSIYLHGTADQASIDTLVAANPEIQEIWRWNPNPTAIQFTTNPGAPTQGTLEWSVWKRGFPGDSDLITMTGQTAYLVSCSGTTANTYTFSLKQRPQLPKAVWVRNSANLLGFPSYKDGTTAPTFATWFATFGAPLVSPNRVFKYIGGPLSATNPLQIVNTSTEKVDRNAAYWFEADVVSDFYAPIEVNVSTASGITFGTTGSAVTVQVKNRTTASKTITFSPITSESAPSGQTASAGSVPLTQRIYNGTTGLFDETMIGASVTMTVAAGQIGELNLGISRSAMTEPVGSVYQSMLKVSDGTVSDIILPVTATRGSLAGLWFGEAQVSAVQSTVAGSPGNTTARSFPLRFLMHVDAAGNAKVLSQAFVGQLDAAPNDVGVATKQSLLKAGALGSASRYVAAHMPLDRVIVGAGTFSLGGAVTAIINTPFDAKVNPFVHQYHPDHDNKNARFQPVGAGVESYTIGRTATFTFSATPPVGTSSVGYGATAIGGTYAETITGIHRQTMQVGGTFQLNRVTEIPTLSE